jgi:hypothetical protein
MSDVEKPSFPKRDVTEALPSGLARSLVKQCREHSERYAKSLFEPLAKQLDDDLFKLVDKTQESEKAQLYNDAMIKLRSERATLAEKFTVSYSQFLSQVLNPDGIVGIASENDLSGLSLVDDAQLEESLVIGQITAKVFEEYSDELYALEQRLSLMLPGLKMDEGLVPFGSAPICSAFESLLRPLGFDIKVKLAIYRSLERSLLESIGTLFGELNEVLRVAGVLPEIKRVAKKNESTEREQKLVVEAIEPSGNGCEVLGGVPGVGGGAGGGIAPAYAFQGVQQLAGLFADGLSGDSEKQQELLAAPVTPQLIEALSGLQISNELLEMGAELSGEAFKAEIKSQLSEREGAPAAGISQLDDETIDVISMIFDDLMSDEALPDFIKTLIFRLQIPVLKVAIIDRVFFAEKEHPARVLLNELTIAGQITSSDDGDCENVGAIYQKIESVVMRVMNEFQGDPGIFDSCLAELREFMAEQEAGFQQVQQQIGEVVQQNSFTAKTKKNIAGEIAENLLNRQVPDDVKHFLMNTWRLVLSHFMLNEGDESEAFKRAEQVSKDLIWSVEPLESAEAKKKLILVVPLILEALQEGLALIGYTDDQVKAVHEMIERYHIANITGNKPAKSESKRVPADEIDQLLQELEDDLGLPEGERLGQEGASLSASDAQGASDFDQMMKEMGFDEGIADDDAPRINDRYTTLVDALEDGVWVELEDDSGTVRRAKLAWKGDEFTRYAFVNWRYKVVAEKSYYALADEFRQGNAAIIEELPLFDRAFDSVFTRIMQLAG